MSKGFIYVVDTVQPGYVQKAFLNVPTEFESVLYFGLCKVSMRPKMFPGHWVFGISPGRAGIRRILFAAKLEERITLAEAYDRFPALRGPKGPIYVRPVDGAGPFPWSSYEHIPGAAHEDRWFLDLPTEDHDAFFICSNRDSWRGRWLGKYGPEIDNDILEFLKRCSVYGRAGLLAAQNRDATIEKPIRHGGLFTGLHLETDQTESLLRLCTSRMTGVTLLDGGLTWTRRSGLAGEYGTRECVPKRSVKKPIRTIRRKC
jgi:hypothetical protein